MVASVVRPRMSFTRAAASRTETTPPASERRLRRGDSRGSRPAGSAPRCARSRRGRSRAVRGGRDRAAGGPPDTLAAAPESRGRAGIRRPRRSGSGRRAPCRARARPGRRLRRRACARTRGRRRRLRPRSRSVRRSRFEGTAARPLVRSACSSAASSSGRTNEKPAAVSADGCVRWPPSSISTPICPNIALTATPGSGRAAGRCNARPTAFVNSRFVTTPGAVTLTGPARGWSSAYRYAATTSSSPTQLHHCRPLPTRPPRPSRNGSSSFASAPPCRDSTMPWRRWRVRIPASLAGSAACSQASTTSAGKPLPAPTPPSGPRRRGRRRSRLQRRTRARKAASRAVLPPRPAAACPSRGSRAPAAAWPASTACRCSLPPGGGSRRRPRAPRHPASRPPDPAHLARAGGLAADEREHFVPRLAQRGAEGGADQAGRAGQRH